MNKFQPPQVTGILLVGGQSRRMGQDKAALPLGPKSLLSTAAQRALEKSCQHLFFVGHAQGLQIADPWGHLPDKQPHLGPLSGVETALLNLKPGHLALILPCDMPNLQSCLLKTLLDDIQNTDLAACFGVDDKLEPFPLLLRQRALLPLQDYLRGGQRSVKGFLKSITHRCLTIPRQDMPYFTNINTPAQLEAWHKTQGKDLDYPEE